MNWKVSVEVEVDLNDIDTNELIKYIEADDCKVIALDEFIEYERMTNLYSELDEVFDKHDLNKIRRQQIIQSVIDSLNKPNNARQTI